MSETVPATATIMRMESNIPNAAVIVPLLAVGMTFVSPWIKTKAPTQFMHWSFGYIALRSYLKRTCKLSFRKNWPSS